MYRIFCESYINYRERNCGDHYRLKISEVFSLIVDVDYYQREKEKESIIYKKLCDLLVYMENHLEDFPRFKSFLWTLESREIVKKYYGVSSIEDLHEQSKLIHMFLKLVYWN